MPFSHPDALLQEYTRCDEKVSRLDNLIWVTASVIFPVTLAGLGFVASSTAHGPSQFYLAFAVGISSITLLLGWYFLSRAWYSYQAVAYYRMREIEAELELWHYRYSLYLRLRKDERRAILERVDKDDRLRYLELEKNAQGFTRIGLRATTAIITAVFIIGWLVLIAREILLSF